MDSVHAVGFLLSLFQGGRQSDAGAMQGDEDSSRTTQVLTLLARRLACPGVFATPGSRARRPPSLDDSLVPPEGGTGEPRDGYDLVD